MHYYKIQVRDFMEQERQQESPRGAVIYADAGVRPVNPGFGGWGFHGYIYSTEPPKRSMGPGQLAITTNGYAAKTTKPTEVTPLNYVDAFGTIAHVSNNGAEVLAAGHALELLSRCGIKDIVIKTDSMYVITGAKEYMPRWRSNNWCKADGTTVSNLEHWKFLDTHMTALIGAGANISFQWVKGHNGDQGNEMADKYATIGALASGAGQNKAMCQTTPADSYWKVETESHPLLAHRSMYFVTDPATMQEGEYYLGNHGKDDELLGKRMADGSYSYVRLDEPDPYIAILLAKQLQICKSEDQIVLARLDELFKPQTRKDLMLFGQELFVPTKQTRSRHSKDLKVVGGSDSEPISAILNPPMLAMRAVEGVNFLKGVYLAWQDGTLAEKGVVSTDITSYFYEEEKKAVKPAKKTKACIHVRQNTIDAEASCVIAEPAASPLETTGMKLRADFTSANSAIALKANIVQDGSAQLDLELVVNIDIPNRNVFKRIEKMSPKITLLVWKDSDKAYRYATAIEAEGGKALWCGYYSNYKYLF